MHLHDGVISARRHLYLTLCENTENSHRVGVQGKNARSSFHSIERSRELVAHTEKVAEKLVQLTSSKAMNQHCAVRPVMLNRCPCDAHSLNSPG